jgi:hypothetical protein
MSSLIDGLREEGTNAYPYREPRVDAHKYQVTVPKLMPSVPRPGNYQPRGAKASEAIWDPRVRTLEEVRYFVNRTKALFEPVQTAYLPLPRRTRTSRIQFSAESERFKDRRDQDRNAIKVKDKNKEKEDTEKEGEKGKGGKEKGEQEKMKDTDGEGEKEDNEEWQADERLIGNSLVTSRPFLMQADTWFSEVNTHLHIHTHAHTHKNTHTHTYTHTLTHA